MERLAEKVSMDLMARGADENGMFVTVGLPGKLIVAQKIGFGDNVLRGII